MHPPYIHLGGDDLDDVVARLFADVSFRTHVNLGSVNSINWGSTPYLKSEHSEPWTLNPRS